MLEFFSARSTSVSSGWTVSWAPEGTALTTSLPVLRPRTSVASTWPDSLTSGKAAGLPIMACETDLASRCDCIRAAPVASTCFACAVAAEMAA